MKNVTIFFPIFASFMFLVGLPTKSFTLNTVPKGRGLSSLPTSSMNTAPQRTQSKMEEEIWKDIPDYEGYYQVSNLGRIRSMERKYGKVNEKGRVGYCYETQYGYFKTCVCKNGKAKCFLIHRLVAGAFIDNIENKPHVNHIDGNKKNNVFSNLEWCTPKENVQHAIAIGVFDNRGEKCGGAILNKQQVAEIRENKNMSSKDCAKKYGISLANYHAIRRRERWKHI